MSITVLLTFIILDFINNISNTRSHLLLAIFESVVTLGCQTICFLTYFRTAFGPQLIPPWYPRVALAMVLPVSMLLRYTDT